MPALGLTDHGVLNGAVEFYKACRKHGVKPILGLEAYLVDDRHEREKVRYERNHLTLLARDGAGFRNLIKLSSLGYLEGFRRGQANVDLELLERHSEGVIALSGCLQSRFCQRIIQEREQEARAHADDLLGVFGAGQRLLRGPEQQDPGAGPRERGHRADRARAGPPAGRDGGRPLPAPRGLLDPRRAAVRADEVDARAAEAELRHERVLSEGRGRDGGGLPRVAGGRPDHARDRRALRHRAGAGQPAAAELRDPGRLDARPSTCGASPRRACASATATRRPPRPSSASRPSSA